MTIVSAVGAPKLDEAGEIDARAVAVRSVLCLASSPSWGYGEPGILSWSNSSHE